MEPGISIRPATGADAEAILEHRLAMLDEVFAARHADAPTDDGRAANAEWLARHLGDDFQAWIAEIDGRIAGSAAILWFPHPPSPLNPTGLEAYVLNVFTAPQLRRRGVARALMERAIEEARARGARRIWLRASDEGRPLYLSLGFRESNYLELVDK